VLKEFCRGWWRDRKEGWLFIMVRSDGNRSIVVLDPINIGAIGYGCCCGRDSRGDELMALRVVVRGERKKVCGMCMFWNAW
jgi:hypothetical protein